MNWRVFLICLMSYLCRGFNLVGNTYVANFRIPLIFRKQNIEMSFLNDRIATLKLKGFINENGEVYYEYDKITKEFEYEPDDNIKKVMNKYLIAISGIYYNETIDEASMVIKSSLTRVYQNIIFENIKSV